MYSSATKRSAAMRPPSVYWLSRMTMPPRGGYLRGVHTTKHTAQTSDNRHAFAVIKRLFLLQL